MKRRKPYAEEFKQEAVTLVTEQGMGVTHVARDLDVSVDTLHRWLRDARAIAHPGTTDAVSSQEIARLRRESCHETHNLVKSQSEDPAVLIGLPSKPP